VDVRNDVRGTGKSIFDFAATYSNTRKLLGMNFLAVGAGALLHETMHQWAAFLDPALELSDGHWRAVNIPGQVFGIDFRDNGDGSYTITQTIVPTRVVPPMELYLMGLIPAEQVPDVTVLRGIDSSTVTVGQVVRPSSVRVVTMGEVLAASGPRLPDVASSPKQYRMAGILITPGRLASRAEMAAYDRMMEQYGSDDTGTTGEFGVGRPTFNFGTGYRARMDYGYESGRTCSYL
jgi:hypothetical protein